MTTLTEIQTRVSQVLEDPSGTRFSTVLLTEAVRLALNTIDQRAPRLLTTEITVTAGGRDQLLPALEDCLYLVNLSLFRANRTLSEMEPEGEFAYQFEGDQIHLHFSGKRYPKTGEGLRITYAACNRLGGLDGAVSTTLPGAYESPLVTGAAGHACLLHTARLAGTYGSQPEEASRLLAIGQLHLGEFEQVLSSLKVLQEFGFPPGFALDSWDKGSKF
jgi:hypothetical protein